MIWINNGQQNTMVDKRNPNAIPDGWVIGMLYKDNRSRYKWFTNGEKDIKLFPEDKVPSGFVRGRTTGKVSAGKRWYHDASGNEQYFKPDDKIPDGWIRGRNKLRFKRGVHRKAYNLIICGQ